MSLDAIGDDILEIVDEFNVTNATGPSPLTRRLSLKKKLDREVCTGNNKLFLVPLETSSGSNTTKRDDSSGLPGRTV